MLSSRQTAIKLMNSILWLLALSQKPEGPEIAYAKFRASSSPDTYSCSTDDLRGPLIIWSNVALDSEHAHLR